MSHEPPTDSDEVADALQQQVGSNLREAREAQGLSQEHLAHLAGLATRHLQKIEAGQVNVTLRTLARLGSALGAEPGWLLIHNEGRANR
jgi:transcriptional regulator with XRE-family HTH domain